VHFIYTFFVCDMYIGSRKKVQLKPGRSLMDWIRLGRNSEDLTGVGGRVLEVTPEELAKHNTEDDAWLALRGTAFMLFLQTEFKFHKNECSCKKSEDCCERFLEIWSGQSSVLPVQTHAHQACRQYLVRVYPIIHSNMQI
jgi:hypothetical protein